jgi:hypothetical protein
MIKANSIKKQYNLEGLKVGIFSEIAYILEFNL